MTAPETETPSLAERIFVVTAKPLLQWTRPEQGPALGPDFSAWLQRVDARIAAHRTQIRKWILEQGGEQLAKSFDDRGVASVTAASVWQDDEKRRATEFIEGMNPWIAAALGAPRLMADFAHWEKSAYFELDEVVWLSFGLEPEGSYQGRKVNSFKKGSVDAIDAFILRRAELIRRQFTPHGYERRVSPEALFAWIMDVRLEVHPGFAAMLSNMVARAKNVTTEPAPNKVAAAVGSGKFDDREKRSLSMLLAALAITDYGYQPNQARSPIPKEFEDMAARLGLELTRETILKYLRLGASLLPKGWEPPED